MAHGLQHFQIKPHFMTFTVYFEGEKITKIGDTFTIQVLT